MPSDERRSPACPGQGSVRCGPPPRHSTSTWVASSRSSPRWCSSTAADRRRIVSAGGSPAASAWVTNSARRSTPNCSPVGVRASTTPSVYARIRSPGLEALLVDGEPVVQPDPERAVPRPAQRLDDAAGAQEQRLGVPGVDPREPAAGDVEVGEQGGDERALVEQLGERVLDPDRDVDEAGAGAAAVAVGADGDRREHAGAEPVPQPVEDGEAHLLLVDGVVDEVAPDVVGRLEHGRDDHVARARRQRRHERPLDLRGQRHLALSLGDRDRVAGGPLGHDELGDEGGELPRALEEGRVGAREAEAEDPHALQPVQDGHPEPDPAVVRDLLGLRQPERPAGDRAVDADRLAVGGERDEHPLGVVHEEQLRLARAELACGLVDHAAELAAGRDVRVRGEPREGPRRGALVVAPVHVDHLSGRARALTWRPRLPWAR